LDHLKEQINPNVDFDRLGLDSAIAVSLLVDLEEWLGIEVSPSLLFEKTTLAEISEYLGEKMVENQTNLKEYEEAV